MRKLRVGLFLAAAAAASVGFVACGDDSSSDDNDTNDAIDDDDTDMVMIDAAPPDAPVDAPPILIDAAEIDDSCAGNPAPTTAPAEIVLSGNVQEVSLSGGSAVVGATVDAVSVANDMVLQSTTSGAQGAFSLTLTTGGTPVNGYARLTNTGFRRTAVYPPSALAGSFTGLPAPIVTPATFGNLELFAGVEQNDTVNGALLVLVSDCAGEPVNGATVTVTQNGASVGTLLDLSDAQPGAYAFFNVPAGVVTVGATYNGTTFRAHDVKAFANSSEAPNGTITATLIQPGYADL